MPLSIHGVIVKPDGEKIEVAIGENEEDPVFTITDLLPHLAQEQMEKKLKEGIAGEDLNILVGSIPFEGTKAPEKVKLNILNILNKKYGITEVDFMSSELELVPAFQSNPPQFPSHPWDTGSPPPPDRSHGPSPPGQSHPPEPPGTGPTKWPWGGPAQCAPPRRVQSFRPKYPE